MHKVSGTLGPNLRLWFVWPSLVLVSQQPPELHLRLDDDGGALMTMAPNISPSAPLQSQLELRDAECCTVVTVLLVEFARHRSLEAMSPPLLSS
jgi:hypothetical protein